MFTSPVDSTLCAADEWEPPPAEDDHPDWAEFQALIARDPERISPPTAPALSTRSSGAVAAHLDGGTAEPESLADAEVIDAIIGFERVLAWAGARQARLLAEFATRRPTTEPAEKPTSRWAPDEIALALSQSRITPTAKLAQAVQLRNILGDTLTAWETGRLDALKVRAICDTTLRLDEPKAQAVQNRALPRAAEQTLTQLKAALKRAVLAVDPDGGNQRHDNARKERRVVRTPVEDGMATLWAFLTAPDAQACHSRLTALARGLGKTDPRGMDARRADLMRDLLTGRLTIIPTDHTPTGPGPSTPAPRPTPDITATENPATGCTHCAGPTGPPPPLPWRPPPVTPGKPLVQIIVPLTTLTGADDQPVELVGYGPIPSDTARTIAADAVWKRLVTDPLSGTLLDHGRTTYRPTTALSDFVRARDQTCRFPPCNRRAIDIELDHTASWTAENGPTADRNLYGACPHHHHLKHDAPG